MTNKKEEFKPNLFLSSKKTKAFTGPYLLFFQFQCPHCDYMNVMRKGHSHEFVLCSNSECRRIIMLENFKDIA